MSEVSFLSLLRQRHAQQELETIPGNVYALSELYNAISIGGSWRSPLAFVGAGASAEIYPLWQDLVERMCEMAVLQGHADEAKKGEWMRLGESEPPEAVKAIKDGMGEFDCKKFISETFSRRASCDGQYYTRAHAAVVNLPFKGIVTTNYDAGLLEARARCRSNCGPLGVCTRLDKDKMAKWYDGSIFDEEVCPIFYAHGVVDRPETWVLDSRQYDEAYKDMLYLKLFEKFWTQERLVCIGFSFNDFWIKFLAKRLVREFVQIYSGAIRHFILVGFSEGDEPTSVDRRYWVENLGARVIYYPVRKGAQGWADHSALVDILETMRKALDEGIAGVPGLAI